MAPSRIFGHKTDEKLLLVYEGLSEGFNLLRHLAIP